jgi:hypothetical protein
VRHRSPLSLALGLAVLVVPLIVANTAASSGAGAERARVIAYWTPGRLAAAVPRDLKPVGVPVPKARPGGGGGGVTGASWTGGGAVQDQVGKVFFHMGGGDWQCSGSVVSDAGRSGFSMVLTAGHCGIDETSGEFASNWLFMPNWDAQPATFSTACSGSLYGCWTTAGGGGLYVDRDFATAGSFNDQAVTHDWTFAVVGPGGKSGGQLDGTKATGGVGGSYPIAFSGSSTGVVLGAFGYHAGGKYHGSELTYCSGAIIQDSSTSNLTWGMPCDMTGGSSGGPWFDNYNASNQTGWTLASLNSYGYSGVKNMYGPKFNAETQATYNAARTDTTVGNTQVP